MIILPLPPSINKTYSIGSAKLFKNDPVVQWEHDAYYLLKQQWKNKPFLGHVALIVRFYFKIESDISNRLKVLEDALEGHMYENDKQIYEEHIYKILGTRSEVEIECQEINNN